MDSFECTAWSTQNSAVSLFFDWFEQLAHHFNKNCLTISNFSSKSNSDHCSSSVVVFKERSHQWLLLDQFLVDCHDLHVILTRIVSQMWTKSKSDYRSTNSDIFRVSHLKCTLIFSLGRGKLLLQWPYVWSDLADVIRILFSLRMSSVLLGPIGPTAAEEGGGKRAARERVKSNLEKNLHLAMPCPGSLLVL